MKTEHTSVLTGASIAALDIRPEGCYLDATFGRGGHSAAILALLGRNGRLYAVDRDPQAAAAAAQIQDARFHFSRGSFSQLDYLFADLPEQGLDGILFDLGVSSPQLEQAERGFSFNKSGPLDMRMDPESGQSAADWLARTDEATLARVIRDLGGEPHTIAKRLAKAVIEALPRLHTTLDLAEVLTAAMPKKMQKKGRHPATQTFQAIRMAVNDEVGELERGLQAATKLLKPGGKLAVITFHGLEDALVKRFIRAHEGERLPAEIPAKQNRMNQVLALIQPAIKPSSEEVALNPRARSARLRRAVKI